MYVIELRDAYAHPAIGPWPVALIWTDPPAALHTTPDVDMLVSNWFGAPLVLGEGERSQSQIANAILEHTEPGELVVDPFCGTGTTGVVAVAHGRNFYGCDTDPAMVRRSRARLETGTDPG